MLPYVSMNLIHQWKHFPVCRVQKCKGKSGRKEGREEEHIPRTCQDPTSNFHHLLFFFFFPHTHKKKKMFNTYLLISRVAYFFIYYYIFSPSLVMVSYYVFRCSFGPTFFLFFFHVLE